MDIKALRNEYKKGELKDESVHPDPIRQFEIWFEQALHANLTDVNAMTLATVSKSGKPSTRTVLLKEFNDKGFVFYTNYESRKGTELIENPNASLLFFWKELERQIRIEGKAVKTSPGESDNYFDLRDMESRISAIISPQSQVIPSRHYLEDRWLECLKEVEHSGIKRPAFWGGFRIIPDSIEFWQGRPNRLHDRIKYILKNGGWERIRLAP